jgi:hypothetical protein
MNYEEKREALRHILREDSVLGRGVTSTKDGESHPSNDVGPSGFLLRVLVASCHAATTGTSTKVAEATGG